MDPLKSRPSSPRYLQSPTLEEPLGEEDSWREDNTESRLQVRRETSAEVEN